MPISKEDCERQIIEKAKEIREIYNQYNPDGNYLSMCIINEDHYIDVHNAYKEDDYKRPISMHVWED